MLLFSINNNPNRLRIISRLAVKGIDMISTFEGMIANMIPKRIISVKSHVLMRLVRFTGSIKEYRVKEVKYLEVNIEEKSINNIKIVFFLVSIFLFSLIYAVLFLLTHHVDSYILKIAYLLLDRFFEYFPSIIDSSN